MPKVKNITYPAAAGFVLSFLISLVATHRFGSSLLKGLLFALVFAVLAFVIDFVWGRYLGEGDEVSDISGDSPKADKGLGSKVDITIDDADLSDDGKSLKFAVDRNRAKLSESDTQDLRKNDVLFAAESKGERQSLLDGPAVPPSDNGGPKAPSQDNGGAKAPAQAQGEAPSSFKPVSLGKPLSASASSAPAPEPSAGKAPSAAAKKAPSSGGEMDGLPDIGGFDNDDNYVPESDLADAVSPVSDSSDFTPSAPTPSGSASKATEHDTATLAKAISTVLKRDEMS